MERRKYPRFSVNLPVECWKTDSCLYVGISLDLSETGLSIRTVKHLNVGDELKMKVLFANGYEFDSFELHARVVWKGLHFDTDWKGYRYGLALTRISYEDQQKLRQTLFDQLLSAEVSGKKQVHQEPSSANTKTPLPAMPRIRASNEIS